MVKKEYKSEKNNQNVRHLPNKMENLEKIIRERVGEWDKEIVKEEFTIKLVIERKG